MHLPFYLISVILACVIGSGCCSVGESEKYVESPLHVGAFNIQKLGNSKMNNKKVMNVIIEVLTNYDLVLVQEIVTTDEKLVRNLLSEMNKLMNEKNQYEMSISERLGRAQAKEQYAFIYKKNRLRVLNEEAYPDTEDEFMRPPYIVHFTSQSLMGLKSLIAIGIHTQPKNAANETSALATVYDYAKAKYKQNNAIIMGDMNAGCQNVRISDWPKIDLWTRSEFQWLISHDIDTTVSDNCCPYDRIVIAGDEMFEAVIWDSIHVYNFMAAHDLTTEEALQVSDHWPVGVQLRGRVSDELQKYVGTQICLKAGDFRKRSVPPEMKKQKSTMGFRIDHSFNSTRLSNGADEEISLISGLEKISSKFPDFLPKELVETVAYKIEYEALHDRSAYTFSGGNFHVTVTFDGFTESVSVLFCCDTTIN